jgi:hypothetical protein
MTKLISIAIPLLFLAGLPAWAGTDPGQAEHASSVENQDQAASDSAETAEPTGIDLPVDGSSLKAFDMSMEKIKETASEAQYKTLENAIEFLLLYDLGVKHDKTKLVAKLDGMTGREIIGKIKWRQIQK